MTRKSPHSQASVQHPYLLVPARRSIEERVDGSRLGATADPAGCILPASHLYQGEPIEPVCKGFFDRHATPVLRTGPGHGSSGVDGMIQYIAFGAACGTTVANLLAYRKLRRSTKSCEHLEKTFYDGLDDIKELQVIWGREDRPRGQGQRLMSDANNDLVCQLCSSWRRPHTRAGANKADW